MIIEKNTNKHDLQYATPELRKRTNEHLDSVIMHTFMRLSHLKKNADGFKAYTYIWDIYNRVRNMGMDTNKQRNHHWFKPKNLKAAIQNIRFDMAICNITKYLDDLCRLGLMELKLKGRSYTYRVKPLQTVKPLIIKCICFFHTNAFFVVTEPRFYHLPGLFFS